MKNMIAENLLKLQIRSGKSKKEFASTYGIKDSTFSSYITGRAIPPVDMLIDICNGEGVELDWLCGRNSNDAEISVSQIASILYKLLFQCPCDCEDIKIDLNKGANDFISEASISLKANDTNTKLLEMISKISDLKKASVSLTNGQHKLIKESILNDYSTEFLH